MDCLPVKTDEEENQSSGKEKDAHPVEAFELLHLRLAVYVELEI